MPDEESIAVDGFIFVNKPAGPSSFSVVRRIRPQVKGRRIGHSGTLDPSASGLLIIAVGKATRLIGYLPSEPKRYTFTLHFGTETDTLDNEGNIVESGGRVPDKTEIAATLSKFVGTILQEPPRFSAIKIDGKRAYKRARDNETFIVRSREVTISKMTIESFDAEGGTAVIATGCSTGTYVRSLARDIARSLGTFGFASNIRRSAIGPFTLEDAHEIEEIVASVGSFIIPVRTALKTSVCVTIPEVQRLSLSFGADISMNREVRDEQPLFAFDDKGEIAAVLRKKENGRFHPVKVFL